MEYIYTAKDLNGKRVKDSIIAKDRYEAIKVLKEKNLTVISLLEKEAEEESKGKRGKKIKITFPKFSFSKVSLNDISTFCRQLAISLNSSISLIESLESIADDIDNVYFKNILFEVIDDVKEGKYFSKAIEKHKGIFSNLFVALVKSAEESGNMAQTLEYLSDHLEKDEALRRKIQSITAYPLFILIFFIIIIFVVTLFVIPQFQNVFAGFNTQLPKLTQIVFAVNSFVVNYILFIILGLVSLGVGIYFYAQSEAGRYRVDKFKLNVPLLRDLVLKSSVARFSRVLSVMIRGGANIETALDITAGVTNNKVLEESLDRAKENIISGSDISKSLAETGNFPKLVIRMVGVGESSGRLPEVLERVSRMYEEQVESKLMSITSLFEPVIIVLFGAVVLIFVLSIYVPVFKMATGV